MKMLQDITASHTNTSLTTSMAYVHNGKTNFSQNKVSYIHNRHYKSISSGNDISKPSGNDMRVPASFLGRTEISFTNEFS